MTNPLPSIMLNRNILLKYSPCICVAVLLVLSACCDAKKDRSAGHPHRGLLDKLTPGRFDLKLSSKDESDLCDDKAVMKHVEKDGGKGGTAICGKSSIVRLSDDTHFYYFSNVLH